MVGADTRLVQEMEMIHSSKQSKFKLLAHNSKAQLSFHDCADTGEHLNIGAAYHAIKEVHDWHTFIIINDKKFNSVCFEEVQPCKGCCWQMRGPSLVCSECYRYPGLPHPEICRDNFHLKPKLWDRIKKFLLTPF